MRRTFEGLALALVICAPALGGCQPPWAWGWLLAGVCALAVLTTAWDTRFPPPHAALTWTACPAGRVFLGACLALLAWATLCVLRDSWLGPGGSRAPAWSWRALSFPIAFTAAFALGHRWGRTYRRLRTVLRLIFALAILLALIACFQRLGWGPDRILGWPVPPQRPSGVYTNANRFAVLLAMGWGSGLALLVTTLGARPADRPTRAWQPFALALGIGIVAAGIATTLSRLTFLAMALSAGGVAWAVLRRRTPAPSGFPRAADGNRATTGLPSLLEKLKPAAMVLLPSLVCLGLGFTLGGPALGKRVSGLVQDDYADGAGRWRATQIGMKLIFDEPWWGHGLGRFEAVFRPVQPLELPKRWDALHNDPVQVGVELGWPGLALLGVAVGAWWVFWWRARARPRHGPSGGLVTVAALPIAIPLLCSLADFPLREPATGMLYAFVWGACFASLARTHAPKRSAGAESRRSRALGGFALLVLSVGWCATAWNAGRAGLAASQSPWLGRLDMGEPRTEDWEEYVAALRYSESDPELLYPTARALLDRIQRTPRERRSDWAPQWQSILSRMHSADPLDYRTPYLESAGCEAFQEWTQALASIEQAIALAPAYVTLRLHGIRSRLAFGLRPLEMFDPRRETELQRILGHMRALLESYPYFEQGFVDELMQAGATADEIEPLWAGEQTDLALRRARFWLRFRRWDKAETNLLLVAERNGWYDALQGRVDLERILLEQGTDAWARALNAWSEPEADAREAWMADAVRDLPLPAAQALVRSQAEALAPASKLTVALARRLMQAQDWTHADTLLAVHARKNPTALGMRCWADLAWAMGDSDAATGRAQAAWELSDRSPGWGRWLDQMRARTPKRGP